MKLFLILLIAANLDQLLGQSLKTLPSTSDKTMDVLKEKALNNLRLHEERVLSLRNALTNIASASNHKIQTQVDEAIYRTNARLNEAVEIVSYQTVESWNEVFFT